jgi:hypothetical protein
MKLNAKDLAAGLFLLFVAVAGLYLNLDHSLGSARRMGPGYMPMLVFGLLVFLSAMVLLASFFNGPDPLEKWLGVDFTALAAAVAVGVVVTMIAPMLGSFFEVGYNGVGLGMLAGMVVISWSAGWRLLGLILASMCVFGLLLEKAGLVVTVIATIGVATLAEPEHRAKPLGILGIVIFLVALCWWVFIKELDIRVPVWPNQF